MCGLAHELSLLVATCAFDDGSPSRTWIRGLCVPRKGGKFAVAAEMLVAPAEQRSLVTEHSLPSEPDWALAIHA